MVWLLRELIQTALERISVQLLRAVRTVEPYPHQGLGVRLAQHLWIRQHAHYQVDRYWRLPEISVSAFRHGAGILKSNHEHFFTALPIRLFQARSPRRQTPHNHPCSRDIQLFPRGW